MNNRSGRILKKTYVELEGLRTAVGQNTMVVVVI